MSWNGSDDDGPWGRNRGSRRPEPRVDEALNDLLNRLRQLFSGGGSNLTPPSGFPFIKYGIIGVLFLWLLTGFYRVSEGELAAVTRFGELVRVTEPGLRYHLPSPIEDVQTVKVSEVNVVQSGLKSTSEKLFQSEDSANLMLTGDENIVKVRFAVQWFVKDIGNFLFNDPAPRDTVKLAAESAVREVVAQMKLADILTTGKDRVIQQSKSLLQKMLDKYKIGVQIVKVNLEEVNPPAKVIDAFRDVQRARADLVRKMNEANAYRNSILPEAGGMAQKLIQAAEADRQAMITRAQGEAKRFDTVYAAYQESPDVTLRRLQIENAELVLHGVHKLIVTGSAGGTQGVLPYLPVSAIRGNAPADPEATSRKAAQ